MKGRKVGPLKVTIVGDAGVGKSSLLRKYLSGEFSSVYIETLLEEHETRVQVGDKLLNVSLMDTTGLEDFDAVRPTGYRNTHMVLFCFSLKEAASLDNITRKWLPEINAHLRGIPNILVGCRKDLADDRKKCRAIRDAAQRLADAQGIPYMETSAKTGSGVHQCINEATKAALKHVSFIQRRKGSRKKNICVVI